MAPKRRQSPSVCSCVDFIWSSWRELIETQSNADILTSFILGLIMKKAFIAAGLLCSLFSLAAQAGTAIIPAYYIWDGGGQSCFKISNASASSAVVSVKMFDKTGEPYAGKLISTYIISSLDTPFTLEPRRTATFCMNSGGNASPGYGVIEGQPSDSSQGQISLVASGYYGNNTPNYAQAFSIVINGGMPF